MTRGTRPQGWAQVDEVLFLEDRWFVIDAGGVRVPRVVVANMAAGMALIGQGTVATVVGRVRPGVVVVDVDVEGDRGHAVTEQLASWCHEAGLWHLVRPSGGADGRAHLFVVAGDHRSDLEAFAADLRASWRLSGKLVDVREAVRPLTAPHKTGGCPKPLGEVSVALRGLRKALRALERAHVGSQASAPAEKPSTALREPLVPRRERGRRELPAPWRRWLETGVKPDIEIRDGGDTSRSTWEAMATERMVQAGWSCEQAWAAIADAHPDAMSKARGSYTRWVTWVWNAAVAADDAHRGTQPLSPETAAAVEEAGARLRTLAWSVPAGRERTSLLLVGHIVLDRMARTDQRRVPVPERDLQLDTGLQRSTIRAHLRRLHEAVGQLDENTLDSRARATTSFEFEIPEPRVMSLNAPPSSHTPDARAPLPTSLPNSTPRPTWLILQTLSRSTTPLTAAETAQLTQLTHSPTDEPTTSQERTVKRCLTALARLELASCDAHGRWSVTSVPMAEAGRLEAQRRRVAAARDVSAERAAYRASHTNAWDLARAAAVKRQRAKEAAWWEGLSTHEQRAQRAKFAAKFAALSVHEQTHVKDELVQRALRVGADPELRRQDWLVDQSLEVRERRAQERAVEFATLPRPMQVAKAQGWQSHRDRWGLGRGLPHPSNRAAGGEPVRVPARV